MKGRIHTPVVTIKFMEPSLLHDNRYHWTLRWGVEREPEPPSPSSTRQRTRLRRNPERMGWAYTKRSAERRAVKAWSDELKQQEEKPTFSYAL